jgi:hypothetical protein
MNPAKIDGANVEYHRPADMTDEECSSLHVRLERVNWQTTLKSAWIPTDAERVKIALGQPVILTIYGAGHPAVSLHVE